MHCCGKPYLCTLHWILTQGQAQDMFQHGCCPLLFISLRKAPALQCKLGSRLGLSAGFLDGIKREVVTIYEIIKAATGRAYVATPQYQYK